MNKNIPIFFTQKIFESFDLELFTIESEIRNKILVYLLYSKEGSLNKLLKKYKSIFDDNFDTSFLDSIDLTNEDNLSIYLNNISLCK